MQSFKEEFRKSLKVQLARQLWGQIKYNPWREDWEQLPYKIYNQLGQQLGHQIEDKQLRDQIEEDCRDKQQKEKK